MRQANGVITSAIERWYTLVVAQLRPDSLLPKSAPIASERMGDLIVIPAKNLILIDPERVDKESSMVGHHGALTETEVNVPLLMTSAT